MEMWRQRLCAFSGEGTFLVASTAWLIVMPVSVLVPPPHPWLPFLPLPMIDPKPLLTPGWGWVDRARPPTAKVLNKALESAVSSDS